MRIVFAGTPDFAIPALNLLIESRHDVAAVVTQPDRPSGRGRKIKPSPVKELATKHDIPVLQPEKLRDPSFLENLKSFQPDIMVVAAYGKILPPEVLNLPSLGCVNIHASLLPKHRGAAPVNWAIMEGERQTGVTLMKMDETLDTGEILLAEEIDILEDDDALSVSNMLSVLGANLLMRLLEEVERTGQLKGRPQDDSRATFAPRLKKEHCTLDWSQDLDHVMSKIRGLSPEPGAVTRLGDKTIKILRAEPFFAEKKDYEELLAKKQFEPGSVVKIIKNRGPVIRTKDGLVVLTRVQPPGKRPMSGGDFINGGYVKQGDRFQ